MEVTKQEMNDKLAYEIVSGRRAVCDSIYWQLPSILLVGEAFLFQITLGVGAEDFPIILGSLLGILFCAVVHFSFWRNHVSERTFARMMKKLETDNGWVKIHDTSTKVNSLLPGDFTLETQKLELLKNEYPHLSWLHKVSISTVWYLFFLLIYVIHIIVIVCRVRFND